MLRNKYAARMALKIEYGHHREETLKDGAGTSTGLWLRVIIHGASSQRLGIYHAISTTQ